MTTNNELLPCPFCGGTAKFDDDDDGWNWIECGGCHVATNRRVSAMDDCRPLLAEAWNRRQPAMPADDGWKEAAIAWEVCASLHREYCKGRDPFFKTRQQDFVRHAEKARRRIEGE